MVETSSNKLENLKIEVAAQEVEYRAKEKQITTFLECKKSFFGKFKYYFKYSKKKNNGELKEKTQLDEEDIIEEQGEEQERQINKIKNEKIKDDKIKSNYTLEELLELYKKLEKLEKELKNIIQDLNSLKLKRKNMDKKIKNATLFIEEIDKHKKSIFEFWKYTNKDEMSVLPEGEQEVVDIIKKITKVFDYEEDFEKFGKKMDKLQRKNLTKQETDSLYISATNVLDILNKIKSNVAIPKDIQDNLKDLKNEAMQKKRLNGNEEFDFFGGILQDPSKVSTINNQKHRELPKDKYSILDISPNTKQLNYKLELEKVIKNIEIALEKIKIVDDLPVYKATENKLLDEKEFNIFEINPEKEIHNIIKTKENKINFYKINLKKDVNGISYTNCIFYDNQNKTLPIGQDLSTKILIDISKLDMRIKRKKIFKIVHFNDENDDFSDITIKTVRVFEYDI